MFSDSNSIFWANSGLGVVTLPDFWSTIHAGDVKIVRDTVDLVSEDRVTLTSGQSFTADYIVMCTGWGDHFGMFDAETKVELGLPTFGKHSSSEPQSDFEWENYDIEADKSVNEKLPFLASPPQLKNPWVNNVQLHHRWRLYRRSIPISLAKKGDRSLAIMGQIHTVQTPLVSEVQSFWSILYLLGELQLPDSDTMAREIAEWNAWTRKRYLSQGQKFPYSLYDFLPVCSTLSLHSVSIYMMFWSLILATNQRS
jgi:dimethylaniline monooxygenase (N-oxide forming)